MLDAALYMLYHSNVFLLEQSGEIPSAYKASLIIPVSKHPDATFVLCNYPSYTHLRKK